MATAIHDRPGLPAPDLLSPIIGLQSPERLLFQRPKLLT